MLWHFTFWLPNPCMIHMPILLYKFLIILYESIHHISLTKTRMYLWWIYSRLLDPVYKWQKSSHLIMVDNPINSSLCGFGFSNQRLCKVHLPLVHTMVGLFEQTYIWNIYLSSMTLLWCISELHKIVISMMDKNIVFHLPRKISTLQQCGEHFLVPDEEF